VCEVLGHKNVKRTLYEQVENEYKISPRDIEEVVPPRGTTLLGSEHLNNLTYNEGGKTYVII